MNDCSKDGSWNKILELSRKIPHIKEINLRKNAGQHNAIMAGLHHACGDVIIIMDDDLQHSPVLGGIQMLTLDIFGEYLGRMYLKLNGKPQFVIKETTMDGKK